MRAVRFIILLAVVWGVSARAPAAVPDTPAVKEEPLDPDTLRKVGKLVNGTLSTENKDREAAWDGLRKMGNLAVPALLELSRNKDVKPAALRTILLALGDSKDARAGPRLLELLDAPTPEARGEAARALGNTSFTEGRAALEKLAGLAQEPVQTRLFAAVAGAKLGSPACLDVLRELFKSPEAAVRSRAVFALGKYGGVKQVPTLAATVTDEDRSVREDAVEALRLVGRPESCEALVKATSDIDYRIRGVAMDALRQITGAQLDSPQAWRDWWAKQDQKPIEKKELKNEN